MRNAVTVIGGGNGGHAVSADLTLRGFDVCLYEDARFAGKMKKVFEEKKIRLGGAASVGTAELRQVTSDLKEAMEGAEIVFVAVPAFAHLTTAKAMAPYVEEGQTIVFFPGTFGSLLSWNVLKRLGKTKGVTVAETHTLPYATRLTGEGESLVMSCFKPLKLGVMPSCRTEETVEKLRPYYDCLEPVENVIACGLNSLNPIIHVPGCILNAGRIEHAAGEFYYYTEGFTSCVARATDAIDGERIALLKSLGCKWDIAAHGIGSTVPTDDVFEAVAHNPSFAKIKGPADFNNRYYQEDIPYGLASWVKMARVLGVPCPTMDAMVQLGTVLLKKDCMEAGYTADDWGIGGMTKEEILTYLAEG